MTQLRFPARCSWPLTCLFPGYISRELGRKEAEQLELEPALTDAVTHGRLACSATVVRPSFVPVADVPDAASVLRGRTLSACGRRPLWQHFPCPALWPPSGSVPSLVPARWALAPADCCHIICRLSQQSIISCVLPSSSRTALRSFRMRLPRPGSCAHS